MNFRIQEIQKIKEEIAKMSDEELEVLGRITFKELIRREAKKMILRLVDQQKQPE